MSFLAYTEYKDLDVEWSDEIPSHWELAALKSLASSEAKSFTDGDWIESPYITDEGIRLVQTGNIGIGHYKEQGFRYISEETFRQLNCTEVKPNSVLICRLAEPVGRACLAPQLDSKAVTSVDIVILRVREQVNPAYVVYFLSSAPYLQFMDSVARGGTRQRVSRSFLGDIKIPLPPSSEQDSIATFLDHETTKIDALVEEQKRLIKLLKEKRQALISQAVTKGLDPNVPMKDSGVEWLGEVPTHWIKARLKNLSPRMTVGIVVNPSTYVADYGLPFIYGGEVKEGQIYTEDARRITPDDSKKNAKTMLQEGDLITVRVGYPGITAVVPASCNGGNCASVMLIKKGEFCSEWLCYLMNSPLIRHQVEIVQYGAAQKQFNIADAVEFWLFRPPIEEQAVIAEHLRRKIESVDRLIKQSEINIKLLKERRSALISAAVTGKIDVRNWHAPQSTATEDQPTERKAAS